MLEPVLDITADYTTLPGDTETDREGLQTQKIMLVQPGGYRVGTCNDLSIDYHFEQKSGMRAHKVVQLRKLSRCVVSVSRKKVVLYDLKRARILDSLSLREDIQDFVYDRMNKLLYVLTFSQALGARETGNGLNRKKSENLFSGNFMRKNEVSDSEDAYLDQIRGYEYSDEAKNGRFGMRQKSPRIPPNTPQGDTERRRGYTSPSRHRSNSSKRAKRFKKSKNRNFEETDFNAKNQQNYRGRAQSSPRRTIPRSGRRSAREIHESPFKLQIFKIVEKETRIRSIPVGCSNLDPDLSFVCLDVSPRGDFLVLSAFNKNPKNRLEIGNRANYDDSEASREGFGTYRHDYSYSDSPEGRYTDENFVRGNIQKRLENRRNEYSGSRESRRRLKERLRNMSNGRKSRFKDENSNSDFMRESGQYYLSRAQMRQEMQKTLSESEESTPRLRKFKNQRSPKKQKLGRKWSKNHTEMLNPAYSAYSNHLLLLGVNETGEISFLENLKIQLPEDEYSGQFTHLRFSGRSEGGEIMILGCTNHETRVSGFLISRSKFGGFGLKEIFSSELLSPDILIYSCRFDDTHYLVTESKEIISLKKLRFRAKNDTRRLLETRRNASRGHGGAERRNKLSKVDGFGDEVKNRYREDLAKNGDDLE